MPSRMIVAPLFACLAASGAVASVDRSPAPGGVYRLKPGFYVAQGASCRDPANAVLRRYDGRGISGAHTRACRVRILSRRGDRLTVDQSCIDAGAGPAPRTSERLTVTVHDALTVTVATRGAGTTYRYCPIDQLPADLRKVLR